jgi:hypothetical protein
MYTSRVTLLLLVSWTGALAGCGDDTPDPLTEAACSDARGEALGVAGALVNRLGDPGTDLGRSDRCPGGRKLLGVLESAGDTNGALCCQIPRNVNVATCGALGGYVFGDPGDGSSFREGCPGGGELLGWALSCDTPGLCGEGGICCRPGNQ